MHARIEHLLSLRDGRPVDAQVRAHVEHCPQCTRALAEAAQLRSALRGLPQVEPAATGYEAVRERIARRARAERRRSQVERYAVVASLSVITLALAWRFGGTTGPATADLGSLPAPAEEARVLDRVAELRTRSAALEEVLEQLGERPVVQRGGTALPIDSLEVQVQWIDHRISASHDALEAEGLWRDRVETMGSLVQLRYVEAQQVAM